MSINTSITFGEHLHRLRRERKWSLHQLAQRSGLSYYHLSRMENGATLPSAESVAKLADALEADVKPLLELAKCLPRTILDRLMSRQDATRPAMRRGAPLQEQGSNDNKIRALTDTLSWVTDLDKEEAADMAVAMLQLAAVGEQRRQTMLTVIEMLSTEEPDDEG